MTLNSPDVLQGVRKGCEISAPGDYYSLIGLDKWRVVNIFALQRALLSGEIVDPVQSLRLSTGIMGSLKCSSGRRGPKNHSEIVLGLGEDGIAGLIALGALSCITCGDIDEIDKDELRASYDARRLEWSQILRLGISPTRFYTKAGLGRGEVDSIRALFVQNRTRIPQVGYYDLTSPSRFVEY